MGRVAEFEAELSRRAQPRFGAWHAIDLHNHTPASDDYQYNQLDVVDRLAKKNFLRRICLCLCLPITEDYLPRSCKSTERQNGTLILRGAELNIFVDAWDKPASKVANNLFFHLLVGFDPTGSYSPDYWMDTFDGAAEKLRPNQAEKRLRASPKKLRLCMKSFSMPTHCLFPPIFIRLLTHSRAGVLTTSLPIQFS